MTSGAKEKSFMVCGVCWRVYDWNVGPNVEPESWISLDELVKRKALAPEEFFVSDGYCPECSAALMLYSSHSASSLPRPYLDQNLRALAS